MEEVIENVDERRIKVYVRTCKNCGNKFTAKRKTTKFCCSNCATKYWQKKNKKYFKEYQQYYNQVNEKEVKKKRTLYYYANTEKFFAYRDKWNKKHKARVRQMVRDYMERTGWNTKEKIEERRLKKLQIAELQNECKEKVKLDTTIGSDIRECKQCGTTYRYRFDIGRLWLKEFCCYDCYLKYKDSLLPPKKRKRKEKKEKEQEQNENDE
jgi:protein-arginine kinase activator protein McsA